MHRRLLTGMHRHTHAHTQTYTHARKKEGTHGVVLDGVLCLLVLLEGFEVHINRGSALFKVVDAFCTVTLSHSLSQDLQLLNADKMLHKVTTKKQKRKERSEN